MSECIRYWAKIGPAPWFETTEKDYGISRACAGFNPGTEDFPDHDSFAYTLQGGPTIQGRITRTEHPEKEYPSDIAFHAVACQPRIAA